ncbi:inhibitor of growth proteins N-terminal histone-binding-domain-containing protein [Xylaria bambusicola]|uniref:inhibitor of growth proteins N-terminal histone-binding-domain-containing protein n=1 Tax=Xylaria bambusicola TaxID=326684 RepID=UPI002008E5AA|nr:inhibitor of growth proteins N-terminal histone-binding-domain-containing protein [Xylaria bambusicola]KAI0523655.1 inhibitor of growth proteins N-terminal histone-binding-domain-containing protein [Xylaria bambusicola]
MPRDDLSIDFVKKMAPSVEAQDPAVILEEFIHRMANLPEEVRFIQDEIADKDRSYHDCIKTVEECDNKIQRWIRSNGSHQHNPREAQLRETIRDNYTRAEKLADEKVALSQRAQTLYDKHLRHLDLQIKQLSDRGEPGFTDPDEIPSLIRPSAANNSNTSVRVLSVTTNSTPLNPILNNASPTTVRLSNPQARAAQSQAHISSSAPASPAASMILNRNHRESSAGPGSGVPKRGPRTSSGVGNLPANSSGLARHSSLGPGTPKPGTPGASSRAGSAGPKGVTKASSNGTGRKSTPGAVARRKPPTSKSTLSRVKRAGQSKGSPASTADSELSDADSAPSSHQVDKDEEMIDRDDDEEVSGSDGVSGIDDDEDEEGKRYCLCQAVSYGDMVACDNPSCPFEWFHWSCVGLKSEPEGRWYCPTCSAERAESLKKKGK